MYFQIANPVELIAFFTRAEIPLLRGIGVGSTAAAIIPTGSSLPVKANPFLACFLKNRPKTGFAKS
ncbi:hypothetical protein FHS90_001586 [Rufibacter quisquiliarum]|uniref:Uncharacterized protein n=1 Tax=Rufibacter quisquiliarum TaxID=1549639 RepID=A0A839GR49_9BACT|nr:hypothetical protein [Rufibacter quisquiliarum]